LKFINVTSDHLITCYHIVRQATCSRCASKMNIKCTLEGTEVCVFCGHLSCSVRRQFPSICFVGYDDDDQPSMQSAWVCDITRCTGRSEHVKSTHETLAVFRLHTNSNQYCHSHSTASAQLSRFVRRRYPKRRNGPTFRII